MFEKVVLRGLFVYFSCIMMNIRNYLHEGIALYESNLYTNRGTIYSYNINEQTQHSFRTLQNQYGISRGE